MLRISSYLIFKDSKKLLELYTEFKEVRGPYTRKDGRKIVFLVHKNGKTKSSRLLAKVNLELKLGRLLNNNEEVDHKDENKLNDHPDNLEPISTFDNRAKAMNNQYPKIIKNCTNCNQIITLTSMQRKTKAIVRNTFFCSTRCSSLYNRLK